MKLDIDALYPHFHQRAIKMQVVGSVVNGNPHQHERDDLLRLVELMQARTVFEFGTFNGATALALSKIPCVEKVWTLDLPPGQEPVLPMLDIDRAYLHFDPRLLRLDVPKVEQLFGDSALFDFTPYHGRCDLVFVMGAHSLPYMRSDLSNALKLVTPDGYVIWHAGTPEPVETITAEYDVYMMSERMGLVKPIREEA